MEDIKMNVKTLAAYMHTTIEGLAELAGISKNHLQAVVAGRAQMTADDLISLKRATGIPMENIETSRSRQ